MQSYDSLPRLMAGWDVCLMPFELNESTRFISPTKTLEYLAGEKPVVSTPVRDVIGLYGDVVRIAADAPSFIAACEATLEVVMRSRDVAANRVRELLVEAMKRPRQDATSTSASHPEAIASPISAAGHRAPHTAGFASTARLSPSPCRAGHRRCALTTAPTFDHKLHSLPPLCVTLNFRYKIYRGSR